MKLTEFACYLMIASAFVLGAFLLSILDERASLEPQANAEMIVNQGLFTAMSTGGKSNEEYVYVLDNRSSMLVCYQFSASKKSFESVGSLDIGRAVDLAIKKFGGSGDDRDRGGSNRR